MEDDFVHCEGSIPMVYECPLRDRCGRYSENATSKPRYYVGIPGYWAYSKDEDSVEFICSEMVGKEIDGTP